MASPHNYQPAPTAVVEEQPRSGGLMKKGIRLGGILLGIPCVVFLAVFGGFFLILPGIILISMLDDDDDDWEDAQTPIILLVLGVLFIMASIALCCLIKKKYRKLRGSHFGDTQGRVIGPAGQPMQPSQPKLAPPPAQPIQHPPPVQPQPTPSAPNYPTAEGLPVPDPTVPEGQMYPHVPLNQNAGALPPKGGFPPDDPPPYSP